jgi:hypothetical protein
MKMRWKKRESVSKIPDARIGCRSSIVPAARDQFFSQLANAWPRSEDTALQIRRNGGDGIVIKDSRLLRSYLRCYSKAMSEKKKKKSQHRRRRRRKIPITESKLLIGSYRGEEKHSQEMTSCCSL